jgi:hypothetical protein
MSRAWIVIAKQTLPHNGRSHRGQAKKKPFTAEELEEKRLTKV